MKHRRLKPAIKFAIALILMFAGMMIQADGYLDMMNSNVAIMEAGR